GSIAELRQTQGRPGGGSAPSPMQLRRLQKAASSRPRAQGKISRLRTPRKTLPKRYSVDPISYSEVGATRPVMVCYDSSTSLNYQSADAIGDGVRAVSIRMERRVDMERLIEVDDQHLRGGSLNWASFRTLLQLHACGMARTSARVRAGSSSVS